jgi:Domain of unknown function (DUF4386)
MDPSLVFLRICKCISAPLPCLVKMMTCTRMHLETLLWLRGPEIDPVKVLRDRSLSNADQTVQNISAHMGLLAAAILCYIISFIGDIIITWALYVLVAPVNRALSLLTAWFQLVYAGVALCAVFGLLDVYHLLATPYYLNLFGSGQLHAQVWLLLNSLHYEWSMSLIIFGIHLVLLAVWSTGPATSRGYWGLRCSSLDWAG